MSDEPLPSLRLKPRLRRDPGDAPPPPPPTVVAEPEVSPEVTAPAEPAPETPPAEVTPEYVSDPAQIAESDAPPETQAEVPAEAPAETLPEPALEENPPAAPELPPFELPPPPAPAPAPAATETAPVEPGRLKLRPRLSAEVRSTPSVDSEFPSAIPPPPVLPPPQYVRPVVTTAPVEPPPLPPPVLPAGLPPLAASAPKAPPFIRAPRTSPTAAEAPENSRAFRVGVWTTGVAMMLVIGVGGFLGLRFLTRLEKGEARPPAAESQPAATAEAVETSKENVAPPAAAQSTAGKAIEKARSVVREREQSAQVQGVEEVLEGPAETETAPGRPAAKEAAPAPTVPKEPAPPPPPSSAFRIFVVNLRISGVFQGDPGRAILDGKMVRVGDVVEPQLGIRLVRLDATAKTLHFEDPHGSQMQRRY